MAGTTLKRGFKANSEKLANEYRAKLGIHPCAPMCGFKLAQHLGILIFTASEIDPKLAEVLYNENSGWSALTMTTKQNNKIIIHNETHAIPRQQSNIMHELAHIICKHSKKEHIYDFDIPFGMRDFDQNQEDEAIYLGATLQLSTPCLLWSKKRQMSKQEIADYYTASTEMVTFRMNSTGIGKRPTYKKA